MLAISSHSAREITLTELVTANSVGRKKERSDRKSNQQVCCALPNEMLQEIFNCFTFPERNIVSLVSKKLYSIVDKGDYHLYLVILKRILPRLTARIRRHFEYSSRFEVTFKEQAQKSKSVTVVRRDYDYNLKVVQCVSDDVRQLKHAPTSNFVQLQETVDTFSTSQEWQLNNRWASDFICPTGIELIQETQERPLSPQNKIIIECVLQTINTIYKKNSTRTHGEFEELLKKTSESSRNTPMKRKLITFRAVGAAKAPQAAGKAIKKKKKRKKTSELTLALRKNSPPFHDEFDELLEKISVLEKAAESSKDTPIKQKQITMQAVGATKISQTADKALAKKKKHKRTSEFTLAVRKVRARDAEKVSQTTDDAVVKKKKRKKHAPIAWTVSVITPALRAIYCRDVWYNPNAPLASRQPLNSGPHKL